MSYGNNSRNLLDYFFDKIKTVTTNPLPYSINALSWLLVIFGLNETYKKFTGQDPDIRFVAGLLAVIGLVNLVLAFRLSSALVRKSNTDDEVKFIHDIIHDVRERKNQHKTLQQAGARNSIEVAISDLVFLIKDHFVRNIQGTIYVYNDSKLLPIHCKISQTTNNSNSSDVASDPIFKILTKENIVTKLPARYLYEPKCKTIISKKREIYSELSDTEKSSLLDFCNNNNYKTIVALPLKVDTNKLISVYEEQIIESELLGYVFLGSSTSKALGALREDEALFNTLGAFTDLIAEIVNIFITLDNVNHSGPNKE